MKPRRITERSQVVAAVTWGRNWLAQYAKTGEGPFVPGSLDSVLQRATALSKLDENTATIQDVEAVDGNWRRAECDGCGDLFLDGVVLGEQEYDERTSVLCLDCVREAYEVATGGEQP